MNIFDILGPVMVGPSSSHTAGAVRIGLIARRLLGGQPATAKITLSGSFAATGTGHGTDRALVAGLLGMKPDDIRIPDSFALAVEQGLAFTFDKTELKEAHPNTAILQLSTAGGRELEAGRCTDCGECSRVCPQGIPLHLFNRKFIKDIDELYGTYQAGEAVVERSPLTSYTFEDAEPGIVAERG